MGWWVFICLYPFLIFVFPVGCWLIPSVNLSVASRPFCFGFNNIPSFTHQKKKKRIKLKLNFINVGQVPNMFLTFYFFLVVLGL